MKNLIESARRWLGEEPILKESDGRTIDYVDVPLKDGTVLKSDEYNCVVGYSINRYEEYSIDSVMCDGKDIMKDVDVNGLAENIEKIDSSENLGEGVSKENIWDEIDYRAKNLRFMGDYSQAEEKYETKMDAFIAGMDYASEILKGKQ